MACVDVVLFDRRRHRNCVWFVDLGVGGDIAAVNASYHGTNLGGCDLHLWPVARAVGLVYLAQGRSKRQEKTRQARY